MRFVAILASLLAVAVSAHAADSRHAIVLDRMRSDIEFLASDRQEGRGVATGGIERAAQRIIEEYEQVGLVPVLPDGGWRQTFDINLGSTRASESIALTFSSTRGTQLKLTAGQDCQPLKRGGNGSFTGDLVFLGYGISAPDEGYDDYADIDVEGKTIIIIRRLPGQGDPQSPFAGETISSHAYITNKLKLAKQHKAAAVLLVNDPHTFPDPQADELVAADGFGPNGSGVPFLQIRQTQFNRLLSENPLRTADGLLLSSLQAVADHLDSTMTPVSQSLSSWSVDLTVKFAGKTVQASNLIGMVEGQGPHANETIIIGAHYDHIGFGSYGSRARSRRGEIHNGADDNASGTAAVLELARRIADGPPPKRRILFICFSGEERGLLGSRHYVRAPAVPLEDTVFMFNFDMIGSSRNNRLEINGVGTAVEFLPLVREADDASPMNVSIVENPFGGSDHLPFYRKDIPVMFCFTGITDRYHTPDDDVEMINMDGVVSIVDLAEDLFHRIDDLPTRPAFRKSRRGRVRMTVLGVRPDLSGTGETHGVRVLGVREGSPAADASVQVGDVIVKIGDTQIKGYADLNDYLRQASAGDLVNLTVERNGRRIGLRVTLREARR